ncbi:hypothetical protein GOBAR_AA23503 [Gossypium barbadense]|uniref:Uncharacterized protein n=1 Tax=Gossypium barbadense TaxID=3634 RepID=A0A2P5X1D6_GOSBA|nr:hypothetical protein GOBAR_AA23503 [Gossypium barbadense]
MPSRARASLCKNRLSESSFTLISSLFNSPHLNIDLRPICLSFLQSDEIGGSSSNGRNQDDSLIKHGEYWAQHDELHGACFNASQVTTGKTNDNTNDGMVEISDDERLDTMLEFSSKNIWEHVESDEFMEHVRQGLDSQPSSLRGNQATLIQLPSHILLLNRDPLISPAGRVGLTNYPNPKIAQKGRGKFHIAFLAVGFIEFRNKHSQMRLKPGNTATVEDPDVGNSGIYCKDCCACDNCLNKPDYEDIVLDIRHQIELRNPLAFAPPLVNPPNDSPNFTPGAKADANAGGQNA